MSKALRLFPVLFVLLAGVAPGQEASDRFYQAIRQDDLAALRALVKDHGPAVADARGQTPLMFAAAFGSVDAMKLLIDAGADVTAASPAGVTALHWCAADVRKVRLLVDKGADVNLRSKQGRTPLVIAAATNGSLDAVKLLIEKGADVKAVDDDQVTTLMAATNVDNTAVAKLMLDQGVDVNAAAIFGQQASTPLMAAGYAGNLELTRLLLARHADPNAISAPLGPKVKQGFVNFGTLTALHMATVSGSPEIVRLLLDAGARLDAVESRGMTPLMWAVSNDHPDVRIVRLLVDRGADMRVKSTVGETVVDWAYKFNNPPVLAALKLQPRAVAPAVKALAVSHAKTLSPREAVERSMPLLQRSAASVFNDGGCIACHATPMTEMAVGMARRRGWRVDDPSSATGLRLARSFFGTELMLQGREGGGSPDGQMYTGVMAASLNEAPSLASDAVVHYLMAKQRDAGYWHGLSATRAPMQDGNLFRTALGIRVLAAYGPPARRADVHERIGRAAAWLGRQPLASTDDRTMQLLGLKWADANPRLRATRTRELIALQQADGGWSQTPNLATDAYATGQVLYTLQQLGVAATDPVYRRGVAYLLNTQKDDGSWFVPSRAMKIQPFFESSFPYGHDQWISAAATAWASMALSASAAEPVGTR